MVNDECYESVEIFPLATEPLQDGLASVFCNFTIV